MRGRTPPAALGVLLIAALLPNSAGGAKTGTVPPSDVTWAIPRTNIRPGSDTHVFVSRFSSSKFRCVLRFEVSGGDGRKWSRPMTCGPSQANIPIVIPKDVNGDNVYLHVCGGKVGGRRRCRQFRKSLNLGLKAPKKKRAKPKSRPKSSVIAAAPRRGAPLPAPRRVSRIRSRPAPVPPPSPPPGPRGAKPEPKKRMFRDLNGRVYVKGEAAQEPSLRQKSRRFKDSLIDDPTVREAYKNWAHLSDAGRRTALIRVAELHAHTYGMTPPEVGFRPLNGAAGGFQPATGIIFIDPDTPYYADRDRIFGTMAHESLHRYQRHMALQVKSGRLRPGHKEYEDARAWLESMENYCCSIEANCKRHCDYEDYRNQALEAPAFEEGESTTAFLKERLARYG